MQRRPGLFVSVLAFAALCGGLVDAKESELSVQQRKELQSLLRDFRKARRDAEQRSEVTDKILEIGGPATSNLLAIINKELQPQLAGYRNDFYKTASKSAFAKAKQANLQEVAQLRKKVLDLIDLPSLTKAQLIRDADPAMSKLESLVVVDRQNVLQGAESLQAQREKLTELGGLWEKCMQQYFDELEEKPEDVTPPKFEEYLAGEEEIACRLAVPMPSPTRAVLAANSRLAGRLDPEEARCVLALNLTRNLLGLQPLAVDLALVETGRDHSRDMERLKFFDHTSPVEGKTNFTDRARRYGTTASGENIAMGTTDGKKANEMWFHSPGHFRNMLGGHRRVGIGRSGVYWTEVFGR